MKITAQLLRSKARPRGPLHSLEYLDLSNLHLECVERLHQCTKLQVLKLNENDIDYVDNLDVCSQLWNLNLANNKIKNAAGLRRIVALGTLNLANNDLSWAELANIRHMIILDLSLHGNPRLERDPYYRMHVVDCLPNIWILDGRIVTSAEREQAQQFFEDSELTSHPVRHKLRPEHFTASAHKNIQVNGVFGERAEHLLRRFPVHARLNVDMDRRRLQYLAYNIQNDFLIEVRATNRKLLSSDEDYLDALLESRDEDSIKANMLLLLLVASLQFAIPSHLMQETLNTTRLESMGHLDVMDVFLLPKTARCLVVSLLLSAVKVDKDVGQEKGLYDKLYLSIYHSVSELTWLAHASTRHTETGGRKTSALYSESKCLVAAEVVQLMCVVPAFFDYCTKDAGIKNMLFTATSSPTIVDRVAKLLRRAEQNKSDIQKAYEEVVQLIGAAIHTNALNMVNNKKKESKPPVTSNLTKFGISKAVPRRPQTTPMYAAAYHARGRSSPDRKPTRVKSGKPTPQSSLPQPSLGDHVLLGPQNIGRIISVPESDIVLIQMDVVPAETGAMVSSSKNPDEHYTYVDMKQLYWDAQSGFWRPSGTVGDRITLQAADDSSQEIRDAAQRLAARSSTSTPTPIHSPPGTPYPGMVAPINMLDDNSRQMAPLPRSVSSQLREMYNLKLELAEGTGSKLNQNTDSLPPLAGSKHGRLQSAGANRPQTGGVVHRSDVVENQSSHLAEKKRRNADSEDEILYDRDHDTQHSHSLSRRSSLESQEEDELGGLSGGGASRPSTATTLHRQPTRTASPEQLSADFVISAHEIQRHPPPKPSKPSSVTNTSTIAADHGHGSSTAHSSESQASVVATQGSLECTIEIPQVVADPTDSDLQTENHTERLSQPGEQAQRGVESEEGERQQQDSESASARSQLTARSKKMKQTAQGRRTVQMNTGPRPVSAMDTYRMIVSKNSPFYYMSPYQNLRTEAWKTGGMSKSPRPGSRPESPPPQRPTSPNDKSRDGKRSISIQRGNSWLGGGKDLFWETQKSRPRSGHQAGWKEGLPQRPYSAAAVRAMRRTKTPNIVTPSSLAYDCFIGHGEMHAQDEEDETSLSGSQSREQLRPVAAVAAGPASPVRQLGTVPAFSNMSRPNTPDSWDEGGFR